MFWNRGKTSNNRSTLPGPKDLYQALGTFLVVEEKRDPDWVWNRLKGVTRPAEKKERFWCRVFDEVKVAQAGVKIKDWTSLDDYPDMIIWEGYVDKDSITVHREKYVEMSRIPI